MPLKQDMFMEKTTLNGRENLLLTYKNFLRSMLNYLYPTGTPFTHAQKAESTASKCNKILRPVKYQLVYQSSYETK
jgi:hypothetical protein